MADEEKIGRVTILGTGLIGSSVGLALRARGYTGELLGWDRDANQLVAALERGSVYTAVSDPVEAAAASDVTLLAGPVFSILEWMEKLAPVLKPKQLVTDVGSVKRVVCEQAQGLFNGPGQARFLPGHPMAGKETRGAANADADLFHGAVWLFTTAEPGRPGAPLDDAPLWGTSIEEEWRTWVARFGARVLTLDAERHDVICAWVSHLPQMVATALSALLEDTFPEDDELRAIGGRALREMTRIGGSPYSMWRDIAHTNTEPIATALLALEQRLTYLRENLTTPGLRDEFETANRFRVGNGSA